MGYLVVGVCFVWAIVAWRRRGAIAPMHRLLPHARNHAMREILRKAEDAEQECNNGV